MAWAWDAQLLSERGDFKFPPCGDTLGCSPRAPGVQGMGKWLRSPSQGARGDSISPGGTSARRRDTAHNAWPSTLMSFIPSSITIPTPGNGHGGVFPLTTEVFNSALSTSDLTPRAVLFPFRNAGHSSLRRRLRLGFKPAARSELPRACGADTKPF